LRPLADVRERPLACIVRASRQALPAGGLYGSRRWGGETPSGASAGETDRRQWELSHPAFQRR